MNSVLFHVRTVGGLNARNFIEGIDSILAEFATINERVLFKNTWYVLGLVAGSKAVLLKLRVSDKACVSLRSGGLSVSVILGAHSTITLTPPSWLRSIRWTALWPERLQIVVLGCILTIEIAELIRSTEILCGAMQALSHIRLV